MSIPESIHVPIRATHKNLHTIGIYVRSLLQRIVESGNASESEISAIAFDIELAVHEVCNNIIEHSYGHENGFIVACFRYEQSRNCVNIELCDKGRPFDETNVTPPDLSTPQVGGYGLFLVYQLMDEVSYSRVDEENHWQLLKFLRATQS